MMLGFFLSLVVSSIFWTGFLGFLIHFNVIKPEATNKQIEKHTLSAINNATFRFDPLGFCSSVLNKIYVRYGSLRFRRFLILSLCLSAVGTLLLFTSFQSSGESQRILKEIEAKLLVGEFEALAELQGSQAYEDAFELPVGKSLTRYRNYGDQDIKIRNLHERFIQKIDEEILKQPSPNKIISARIFGDNLTYVEAQRRSDWIVNLIFVTVFCALMDFFSVKIFLAVTNQKIGRSSLFLIPILFLLSADVYGSIILGGGSLSSEIVWSVFSIALGFALMTIAAYIVYYFFDLVLISRVSSLRFVFVPVSLTIAGAVVFFVARSWFVDLASIPRDLILAVRSSATIFESTAAILPLSLSLSALSPLILLLSAYFVLAALRLTKLPFVMVAVSLIKGGRATGASYLGAFIMLLSVSVSAIIMIATFLAKIISAV